MLFSRNGMINDGHLAGVSVFLFLGIIAAALIFMKDSFRIIPSDPDRIEVQAYKFLSGLHKNVPYFACERRKVNGVTPCIVEDNGQLKRFECTTVDCKFPEFETQVEEIKNKPWGWLGK